MIGNRPELITEIPHLPAAMEGVRETLVGVLVLLSLILTVTTVFPKVPLGPFTLVTVVLGALVLGALGVDSRRRSRGAERQRKVEGDRQVWRMPPLPTLGPPRWSLGQKMAMYGLRGYLVLGLKIGQRATGHRPAAPSIRRAGRLDSGGGPGQHPSSVRLRPACHHHTRSMLGRSEGASRTVGRWSPSPSMLRCIVCACHAPTSTWTRRPASP